MPFNFVKLFNIKQHVMTKYDAFKKEHKAAQTEAEQKSLLKTYLLGLPTDELMQFYMETPDVIEKTLKELIVLESEKGLKEAKEYLGSTISLLQSTTKMEAVAA
jgi:hypothetical protein